MDQIEFVIYWAGSASAQLVELSDNGVAVPLSASDQQPRAQQIQVTFKAPSALLHTIQWGLAFAGEERKRLTAEAGIEGGSLQVLDSSETKKDFWVGRGTAIRGA